LSRDTTILYDISLCKSILIYWLWNAGLHVLNIAVRADAVSYEDDEDNCS